MCSARCSEKHQNPDQCSRADIAPMSQTPYSTTAHCERGAHILCAKQGPHLLRRFLGRRRSRRRRRLPRLRRHFPCRRRLRRKFLGCRRLLIPSGLRSRAAERWDSLSATGKGVVHDATHSAGSVQGMPSDGATCAAENVSQATCSRQHAADNVLQTTCSRQRAADNMQQTTCSRHLAADTMQQTTCNVKPTTCCGHHAADSMKPTACNRQHAAGTMQPTACKRQHPADNVYIYI
jgi:hypothetical protein